VILNRNLTVGFSVDVVTFLRDQTSR